MGWIVAGFVTAVLLELFIRVLSDNQRRPEKESAKITMPFYGWGLLGLITWGLLKRNR